MHSNHNARLKRLEQRAGGPLANYVIDVSNATPTDARRQIDERLQQIQRGGPNAPLIVIDQ